MREALGQQFAARFAESEAARIRSIADAEDRSAAYVIRRLVRESLDRQEQPEHEA